VLHKKSTYIKRNAKPAAENPWACTLAETIVSGNKTVAVGKAQAIVNTKTGEMTDEMSVVAVKKKVDRTEFIKIFQGGIASIFNLNKSAKDLFQAILHVYLEQKMKGETVYLTPSLLEHHGYKRTKQTRTQALNTLLNLGFLCEVESQPFQFWVNPNLFYKGDRMQIFQDYAVTGTKAAADMDEEVKTLEEAAKQQSLPLTKTKGE
jgi:hypothetical protein